MKSNPSIIALKDLKNRNKQSFFLSPTIANLISNFSHVSQHGAQLTGKHTTRTFLTSKSSNNLQFQTAPKNTLKISIFFP